MVRPDGAAGRSGARRRIATARCDSSPSAAATTTPSGSRASATGASPGSSGGATASRSGTARTTAAAETMVSRTDVAACPGCGGAVRQDEDVLDTWFSSWLVPFSSLGWPDRTPDLAAFYPGHTLVSAPEILFFWVARMIMSGLQFMGEVPVHHRLPARHGARHPAPQDVQVAGQRHRPARGRGALRRRRAPLLAGVRHVGGTDVILDPADLEGVVRPGPQLRQQAVERRPVHPLEPGRPAAPARRPAERRPRATS